MQMTSKEYRSIIAEKTEHAESNALLNNVLNVIIKHLSKTIYLYILS